MAKWLEVSKVGDIQDGEKVCVSADGTGIVICQIDGDLFAAEDVCPHAGMPLGEGELRGSNLICPFHGYTYDMKSGKNVDWPDDVSLRQFPIRVESDRIEVDVEPA